MSNRKALSKEDLQEAGWGLAVVVAGLAWFCSLVMQFFGAEWYWPWLFFGIVILLIARVAKRDKPEVKEIRQHAVFEKRKVENHAYWGDRESRMPHLTSIPGQYTRKPCSNPEWIRIPFRTDYEINCFSHVVRHRTTRDIIEPGHDPNGKDDLPWIDLGFDGHRRIYIRLDDIVAETLGRGHQ